MKRKDQKNFSVNIDSVLSDKFSDQIELRGQKKFRAIEGSLRLWISLPNEIQARIIESSDNDIADIYNDLGNRLRSALRSALALEKPKRKT